MKLIKHMTKIVFGMILLVPPFVSAFGGENRSFAEDEIKKLNLSESEAAELRQLFGVFPIASPAESQELEQVEKNLREDLIPKEPVRPVQPVKIEETQVVPIVSPLGTVSMLNDIIRHIASLHLKRISGLESINLQLYELVYYLHLITAPDLSLLLSTREFMPLYEKLKHLHAALVAYEPLIVGKRRSAFAENNPYEVLDIHSDATAQVIIAAYEKAKKALSPKIVEQKLKDQGADAKTIKKRVKEATTTFMIIEDAYQVLKDPKKRKKLDARLQEEEASRDQGSVKAFENLYRVLSGSHPQVIVRDAQKLLEQYKPQEAALARAQLEKERGAYERSKQVTKVSQLPPRFVMPEAPYEAFYRKMAQESYQRPVYPVSPSAYVGQVPAQPSVPGRAEAQEKKESKKEGKEEKEEEEEKEETIERKDLEKYTLIAEIADILKKDDDLEKKAILGSTSPTLKGTVPAVNRDLTTIFRGKRGPSQDARDLNKLLKLYEFEVLADKLNKLAPGRNKKIDNKDLKKEWQKKVWCPYGYRIKQWYEQLFALLSVKGRHAYNWPVKTLVKSKEAFYKLNTPLIDPWAPKPGKKYPKRIIDLGAWRDKIIEMEAYFENINAAFGLPPTSQGPVKC